MCFLFYSSFVCIPAYANVYLKTTITKQNIKKILIAGVPSSQVLPGYLIPAPPSVCVPAVIDVLAVWIQKKKTSNKYSHIRGPLQQCRLIRPDGGRFRPTFLLHTTCVRS